MSRQSLALLIALPLALVACAGEDPEQASETPGTTAVVSTTTQPRGVTTPPAADSGAEGEPLLPSVPAEITLATPASGVGPRPLLEWGPVPGADHYGVYLYAPDGAVYWAWTGSSSSVHVGGEPRLDDDQPGPRVSAGMAWGVVAYDSSQLPLATSRLRPIEP